MSNPETITISDRAYQYIRQATIKDVTDAVVELITNSNDAYNRIASESRDFYIAYKEPNILLVGDQATGMSAEQMRTNLLQVGEYTADADSSRGFFSRGAKDITVLGDVYFKSIKDGHYSEAKLTSDVTGSIVQADLLIGGDGINEYHIRQELGIKENGLLVKLEILPQYIVSDFEAFAYNIEKRCVLRDIMADTNNNIVCAHIDENNQILTMKNLRYVYPKSQLLLDLKFKVPVYYDLDERAIATFKVYKSDEIIEEPVKENELEFGFLIKSKNAIHECTTFDSKYRWNTNMQYLYGELKCDYIEDLMLDIDLNGTSLQNPFIVIDPSRVNGIDRDHPFTTELFSIPILRLEYILEELEDVVSRNTLDVNDVTDLLNELEILGVNLFDDGEISLDWLTDDQSSLVKAIEDTREAMVLEEKNNTSILTKDETKSRQLAEIEQQLQTQNTEPGKVYIQNENGELVEYDQLRNPDTPITYNRLDDRFFNGAVEYGYTLDEEGNIQEIYLFERGQLQETNPEKRSHTAGHKTFKLTFSNDPLLKTRYKISKKKSQLYLTMNINDPVVKSFFKTSEEQTVEEIKDVTKKDTLLFLAETMVEAFSRLVVENDMLAGNLELDAFDNFGKMNKIWQHYDKVVTKLQLPVYLVYQRYTAKIEELNLAQTLASQDNTN